MRTISREKGAAKKPAARAKPREKAVDELLDGEILKRIIEEALNDKVNRNDDGNQRNPPERRHRRHAEPDSREKGAAKKPAAKAVDEILKRLIEEALNDKVNRNDDGN